MKYDFGGYITKNDIVCSDGRVIRHDAFKDQDGMRVPLVYQHMHDDINNVLGFVDMENRPDGVYGYGSFNDTANAQTAKQMIMHGDLNAMSIYANQLVQHGTNPVNVMHGNIREVSLVLSGANPGATIDQVSLEHSDGSTDLIDEAVIHTGLSIDALAHADDSDQNGNGSDMTVADIWDTFTDQEKNLLLSIISDQTGADISTIADNFGPLSVPSDPELVPKNEAQSVFAGMSEDKQKVANYIVGQILTEIDKAAQTAPSDEPDTTAQHDGFYDDNTEDIYMKHNVFEDNTTAPYISHAAFNDFLASARDAHVTSLKDFSDMFEFTDQNGDAIQHDGNRTASLNYGIQNIEYLFPDYQTVQDQPAVISRDQAWVADFMNSARKVPFSRIRSTAANITADEARAKGYVTGNKKVEEVIPLLQRSTDPQTIYKKQKLDRDDLVDITDFDVVVWLKAEMQTMLREEVARAALVGDGRSISADDHIKTEHVRPIYGDSDVYTIYQEVSDADLDNTDGLVDLAVRARKDYKGSGSPVFYATTDIITMLLLARDKMGRRLYANESELASAMRVSRIVEVPVLEGATRSKDAVIMGLLGIIVNPNDYTFGANNGGEENFFDDFDIDFNQYKYLIETRTSACLTNPYSAIAIEYDKAKYQLGTGKLEKVPAKTGE